MWITRAHPAAQRLAGMQGIGLAVALMMCLAMGTVQNSHQMVLVRSRFQRAEVTALWLAGVALALALILGLAIAATLIWHREVLIRRCDLPDALGSLTEVRGDSGVPSGSVDLKLELDGKGEPQLLGQGSFAKVSLMGCPKDK